MKYTDPDGQFIHIIIGAVVGGLINGLIHIDRPGGFWKGAVIGAAAGALIAATGGAAAVAASTGSFAGAFSAAAVSTATSGAIGGAIAASVGTAIGDPVLGLGNKAVFGDPYSLKQYGKDVLLAGITGGVASGVSSALGGKNFWTGKATPGTSIFTMPERAFSRWQDSRVGKVSVGNGTGTFDDFIDDRGNLIPKHSFEANFSNQGGEFLDDGARMVEQPFNYIDIQFGKTQNQIYHAFLHTDELGLNSKLVQASIESHFKTVSSQVVAGKPFNQIIEVGGQRLQYTAFKLSDGVFNIGRIHGIK